jgi:hypothetical protein
MLTGFEKIVEERIKFAQKKGMFDNLPGAGQPLPKDNLDHIPAEFRMVYRILRNADCLPPEIELRNEILRIEDMLSTMPETQRKVSTLKRLNFLIMKLNTARGNAVGSDIPQHYVDRLARRIEPAAMPTVETHRRPSADEPMATQPAPEGCRCQDH